MSRSSREENRDLPQIDMREISGCTCLRVRRSARALTAAYDALLAPLGLTINQFGLLAHLHGAGQAGKERVSIGRLAELIGADPTTLNRSLKPLIAQRLVADGADPRDGRVRAIGITEAGSRLLDAAVGPWRQAQASVERELGREDTANLNALLDKVGLAKGKEREA